MRKPLSSWAVLCVIGTCAGALIVSVISEPLPAQSGPPPKIGFAIEAMKGERWQTDLESFEARAKQLGAEVISSDAKGDDDLQYRQVQEMINSGIKVLVLLPHDTTKAARTVDAAKAAHVKVLSYDRLAQNSNVDLYVSFDRAEIGRMQASYLATHAGKGNFVLIGGSPLDEGAKALHDAQIKVLQPYIDRGDVKVIADRYTKDWLPSEAYIAMLNLIDSSGGAIAAVVAANDDLAGGVIQALSDRNLAGKVMVSGQDADLAAVIRVAQGTQSLTIYKPIANQASVAAEQAVRLARGEKISAVRTVNNGKLEVPAVLLPPTEVTRENIKTTVVKDGFQTLKSINLGLSKEQQIN